MMMFWQYCLDVLTPPCIIIHKPMEKEIKFEKAMERLEEIVQTLEKGDMPLEDSLKVFEEGIKLSKTCMAKLDEAEKRVEILVKSRDKTILKPFATESTINDNSENEG